MSERGVFAVDRGIFDHPLFEDKQPFSRREAWLWLISEAEWKPRKRKCGSTTVNLERGQLAHSVRFMADAWSWHRSKVERFLATLKTETMIETFTETGVTLVTICNYSDYQRVSLPSETVDETHVETVSRQHRDRLEDMEDIEREDSSLRSLSRPVASGTDHAQIDHPGIEIVEQGTAPKRAPTRSPAAPAEHEAFSEFWSIYPRRLGTNSRAGAAEKFRALVRSGIDPPALIAGAERYRRQCEARGVVGTEFVQQATTWLNPKNRAWEEAYDLPDRPQQIRGRDDGTLRDGAGRPVDSLVAAVMLRRAERGDRGGPADPEACLDLDGAGGFAQADLRDRGRGLASTVRGGGRGGGDPAVIDATPLWR